MVAGIIFNPKSVTPPINKDDLICGGTIISSQYVITAGHCIVDRKSKQLGVLVGDHNIDSGDELPK